MYMYAPRSRCMGGMAWRMHGLVWVRLYPRIQGPGWRYLGAPQISVNTAIFLLQMASGQMDIWEGILRRLGVEGANLFYCLFGAIIGRQITHRPHRLRTAADSRFSSWNSEFGVENSNWSWGFWNWSWNLAGDHLKLKYYWYEYMQWAGADPMQCIFRR